MCAPSCSALGLLGSMSPECFAETSASEPYDAAMAGAEVQVRTVFDGNELVRRSQESAKGF